MGNHLDIRGSPGVSFDFVPPQMGWPSESLESFIEQPGGFKGPNPELSYEYRQYWRTLQIVY